MLHKELDADDGELTRTRKVRRKVIGEKYDDIITALYDGSTSVSTVTEVTYEDGRKGSIAATLEVRRCQGIRGQPQEGRGMNIMSGVFGSNGCAVDFKTIWKEGVA